MSLIIKFSGPAMAGTILNATYNIVDRIFIGRAVGETGLAAASISFPVMMIMMAFGIMFGSGSGALVSIMLGQGRKRDAEAILGQAFALYTVLSVCFTVFGFIFLDRLLITFGASPTILPAAKEYLSVILIGVFVHEISFGISCLIRSEGNIKASMIAMVIGAGLNIILDPIFLFWFKMGIRGAAIATVLAQTVSAVWVLYYYLGGKSHLKLRLENIRIHAASAKQVILIGCPQFLMNMIACVTQAIIYNSLHYYGGDTEIAVMGVIFTILMLVFMPLIGITQGIQPIIGYNYGAENYHRVRQTVKITLVLSTGVCVLMYIVIMTLPQWLFIPFSSDEKFINIGVHASRRYMMLMPLIGTIFVSTNYFQAVARPKVAILLSIVRQVIIFAPALLILPRFMGVDGIWYSCPMSEAGSFIIAAFLIKRELTNLKYKQKLSEVKL